MNVTPISNKVCRACLDTSEDFVNIFSTRISCKTIATVIMECTTVQILPEDGYPSIICKTCFYKLETAYNFRQLCVFSDKALKGISNVISEVNLTENECVSQSDTKLKNCTQSLSACKTSNLIENLNNCDTKPQEKIKELNSLQEDCEYSRQESDGSSKSIPSVNNDRFRYRLGRPKGEYVCAWCSRRCTDNSRLRVHERIHTGERPFACKDCGARFANHGSLVRHARTHTGEKKYSCVECGARFAYKNSLTIHSRRHTGEKPYVCATCGKRFADNACLKQHRIVHTGERRFTCDYCGKRFAFKATLNIHVRTHTGEKPFLCAVCSKTFRQRTHFQAHMRGHTGEKPFKCKSCNKSYADRSGLRRHQRLHF